MQPPRLRHHRPRLRRRERERLLRRDRRPPRARLLPLAASSGRTERVPRRDRDHEPRGVLPAHCPIGPRRLPAQGPLAEPCARVDDGDERRRAPPRRARYETKYRGPPPGAYPPAARRACAADAAAARGTVGVAGGARGRARRARGRGRTLRTWTFAGRAPTCSASGGPSGACGGAARASASARGRSRGRRGSSGPFPVHLLDPSAARDRAWLDGGAVPPRGVELGARGARAVAGEDQRLRGREPERRVLSAWRVHRVRVEPTKVERWWTAFERKQGNTWRRTTLALGASEGHALVEGGASEMWRLGASEQWSVGGSEWLALGGSEIGVARRARELAFVRGASAIFYGGGASELGSARGAARARARAGQLVERRDARRASESAWRRRERASRQETVPE